MPSSEEYAQALDTLDALSWKTDYVLTHCAASNVQYRLEPTYENDELTRFLFDVERKLDYRHWFFGHYHEDRGIGDCQTAIYNDVVEIFLPPTETIFVAFLTAFERNKAQVNTAANRR